MPWTVMSILHGESVASPEAIDLVFGDCLVSRQGCPGEIGREETAGSRQRTRRRAHGWLLSRDVRPWAFLEAAGETWTARQEPLYDLPSQMRDQTLQHAGSARDTPRTSAHRCAGCPAENALPCS